MNVHSCILLVNHGECVLIIFVGVLGYIRHMVIYIGIGTLVVKVVFTSHASLITTTRTTTHHTTHNIIRTLPVGKDYREPAALYYYQEEL